jgi:hypothetical protein
VEKERSGKELVTKVNGGEPPRETGPTANGTHVVRIASQAEFDGSPQESDKVPFGVDLGLCRHEPRFSLRISPGQPQSRIASAHGLTATLVSRRTGSYSTH